MLRVLAIPALLFAAALAGCLGNDEPVDTASTTPFTNTTQNATAPLPDPVSLTVATSGIYPLNPAFAQATLEAKAGAPVNLTFRNADPNPITTHDWVLEGVDGAATERIGSNAETTVAFTAPAAGTYKYFCSVGDHRARGMEGELTVTA